MTDHAALLEVVRSVRRRWRLRVLLRGAGILLLSAVALLAVAGYAVDASRFDAATVTAARVLGGLVLAAVLFWALARPLARRVSDRRAALYLEEHEPSLGGRVISAVDLDGAASPALVERLVRSARHACHDVDDGKRVERAGLWRSAAGVAAAAVLGLGLFGAGPSFLERTTPLLLDPWQEAGAVNPYRILVEPGDATVARGADLRVTAALEGFDAAEVELAVRNVPAEESQRGDAQTAWQRWPMVREEDGHSLIVFDLEQPTEYFAEASGVRSQVYRIEVQELPYVENIDLTYRFPAYTGLEPLTQAGSGDVAALAGTVVELAVTPTLPVSGGVIELEREGAAGAVEAGDPVRSTLPLTVVEDGRLTGSMTAGEPASYRILLDGPGGERVVASPDYLIDPLSDQPPAVSIAKPGRDIRASNLEEVAFEVRAQDDHGVSRLELVYAVGGGEEQAVDLYRGRPGRKDLGRSHTLFLEELERDVASDPLREDGGGMLQPGDLVSYYARARDASDAGTGGPNQAVTDIYFLEIRPFDRNYRQAEEGGLPGGQGMSGAELTAQQRMIVAATFKAIHGRLAGGAPGGGDGDLATITLSQGRLREQVETLIGRLEARGLMAGDDSPAAVMAELLPQAAAEMTAAEQALGEQRPDRALPPEQKALQLLQQAEAAFTDVEVSEGRPGGGAGGGGDIRDELAELFDQERDRLRNRYEQVQRGERQRHDDQVDETLEKLRELARRQQQENERMRARARQAGDAQAGSSGRSQRQLAEETGEVARKLERLAREQGSPELAETARRLREAAREMRRAAAAGERAGEAMASSALERLRDARKQLDRDKSGRTLRDTRDHLRRARALRRQQQRMVERVDRLEAGDGSELAAVDRTKERMGAEVGELEAALDELARDARRDQPEASRRLDEAAGQIRDDKIREKILYSRGVVQQRSKDYARNFEQHIESTLAELEARLADAAAAIGEGRGQRLERALEETRDAVTALESLEERLRADGREGRTEDGAAPGGNAPLPPRQLRRELGQRAAQLERLRESLSAEGIDAGDLDTVIGRLRQLSSGGALAETLAALDAEVVRGLKEFEFALRRSLAPAGGARALQASGDDVPDGFEDLVDRYYKALAEGTR